MFKIKQILATAIMVSATLGAQAQSLPIPQPSPTATITQAFATGNIELSYSRPSMKGRKIFGDLVPFGSVWRTGANGATTIAFGDTVTIGGTVIPKGKYGLLSIPGETEWTIIISKDATVNDPANNYKQTNDLVRVKVKPIALSEITESFTIEVNNIKSTSAEVCLRWDKTAVAFTVNANIDAKIMTAIDKEMAMDKRPYFQSASYYFENGKDLNKAYEWIGVAAKNRPDAYWVLLLKAKIEAKLGKLNDAVATATESRRLADADKDLSYVKQNDALLAEIKANPLYKELPGKKKK
ncbi:MAG: hypothetical protein RIQ89_595 [Bacteroidota bacterium]|jgi:hypothetical protein